MILALEASFLLAFDLTFLACLPCFVSYTEWIAFRETSTKNKALVGLLCVFRLASCAARMGGRRTGFLEAQRFSAVFTLLGL